MSNLKVDDNQSTQTVNCSTSQKIEWDRRQDYDPFRLRARDSSTSKASEILIRSTGTQPTSKTESSDRQEIQLLYAAGHNKTFSLFDRLVLTSKYAEPYQSIAAVDELKSKCPALQDLGIQLPLVLDHWFNSHTLGYMTVHKKIKGQSFQSISDPVTEEDFDWVYQQSKVLYQNLRKLEWNRIGLPNFKFNYKLLHCSFDDYFKIDENTTLEH